MRKGPLDTTDMIDSPEDFGTVYETYAQGIYRFLLWRTSNKQLSEDLTSNVFVKAWHARRSFQGGSVQAWLYRIARNVLIDHWRKDKAISIEDPDVLTEAVSDDRLDEILDREMNLEQLRRAVHRLPEQMRTVVTLRFIEGLSCRQVAIRLHTSEGNVRILQYRALRKLRGYLHG